MKKHLFLLLFSFSLFGQNMSIVEENIYKELDAFVAKPTIEGLNKLEVFEKKTHPKTESEIIAFFTFEYNLGYYQNLFGNTKKAIVCYENAWSSYQKNKLFKYEIVDSCLIPLGNLYTIIGDYDNAENIIKHYFYIANNQKNKTEGSRQKYIAILSLSNVYQNTGKIDQGIDLINKTIKTENLSAIQKGNLLGNLGANYLVRIQTLTKTKDDFINAEKSLLASIELLNSFKTQSENLSNAYRNLSRLYILNNSKKAFVYFEKAKTEFAKISNIEPRKKAQFYIEEAQLLFKQGKNEAAENKIQSVYKTLIPNYSSTKNGLPNIKSVYAETILLDALDLQSEIFLIQNQPKKALESYQISFKIEDLFQSLLVYENSKIVNQIRNRNRVEKCISIYFDLYQKEKKIKYLETAFELSENNKSSVLKNSINHFKNSSREEKQILEQLQNWNNVILKEQKKGNSANISKINEAIKKQNELMLLLKSKESKITNQNNNKFKIEALYLKLKKENATMVSYFSGSEKFYIFTIYNKTVKLDCLFNNQEVVTQIMSFLNYFSNAEKITNNVLRYNNLGYSIYKTLKLPKKTENKNLIIIPDGILNFLPFEALITKPSTTSNFSKMNFLLFDYSIGYSNSATFYIDKKPFQHPKETVLGIFPIFENSNLELTYSKKELENLKSNFDGKYLEKQNATFLNFKLNSANYSILHLSTHASSGDIYEPASIRFYNQEILYSELYNLKINPDLVVLSACETGLGALYKAEGAMSISRGFKMAGAQNLLFSLWKVNDFTTSVLMKNFYTNLKNSKSYFESNHQSKLDFLNDENISNAKKSPYYWAAFVYYGTLETKESNNYYLWISIAVSVISALLFWLFLSKRKQKNLKN